MTSQFNQSSSNYDDVLNEGLRVTGEDKDYFATARVRWTARRLAEFGTATRGARLRVRHRRFSATPVS